MAWSGLGLAWTELDRKEKSECVVTGMEKKKLDRQLWNIKIRETEEEVRQQQQLLPVKRLAMETNRKAMILTRGSWR